jgi:Cys-rich repeat protein
MAVLLVLIAVWMTACSPSTGVVDSGSVDPATIPLNGMCDLGQRFGTFTVAVDPDYSSVYGSVNDGVVPLTVLQEVLAAGECRLMKQENPFCDPPCAAGDTCDLDQECVAYPQSVDLGTVTVVGLDVDVSMAPLTPGYTYFEASLPHPPFQPGALVALAMDEGPLGPLSLHGVGFTPVEILDAEWVLTPGEPLTVTWSANTDAIQRSVVSLRLSIDQHGTSPVSVWCSFEDDAVAEIPASLVDGLLEAGITGFPSGELSRRTEDHRAVGQACVDFTLASPRTAAVSVSGHTPCFSDEDCPAGQSCNLAVQTCE